MNRVKYLEPASGKIVIVKVQQGDFSNLYRRNRRIGRQTVREADRYMLARGFVRKNRK